MIVPCRASQTISGMIAIATQLMMLPSYRPELSSISSTSEPYPPPPNTVFTPPVTINAYADSTMTSASASIRKRVFNSKGKKAAKTNAFQTQPHFS